MSIGLLLAQLLSVCYNEFQALWVTLNPSKWQIVMIEKDRLTEAELAERWGMKRSTLRRWRSKKYAKGPKFLAIGRKIRYPIEEVEKFEKDSLNDPPFFI